MSVAASDKYKYYKPLWNMKEDIGRLRAQKDGFDKAWEGLLMGPDFLHLRRAAPPAACFRDASRHFSVSSGTAIQALHFYLLLWCCRLSYQRFPNFCGMDPHLGWTLQQHICTNSLAPSLLGASPCLQGTGVEVGGKSIVV